MLNKLSNYDLIAVFLAEGVRQYLIKTPGGVSTMPELEYKRLQRCVHPEHWKGVCHE